MTQSDPTAEPASLQEISIAVEEQELQDALQLRGMVLMAEQHTSVSYLIVGSNIETEEVVEARGDRRLTALRALTVAVNAKYGPA